MKTCKKLQTVMEGWDLPDFTRERLLGQTKDDLVRFYRTFMGGKWSAVRAHSKNELTTLIINGLWRLEW